MLYFKRGASGAGAWGSETVLHSLTKRKRFPARGDPSALPLILGSPAISPVPCHVGKAGGVETGCPVSPLLRAPAHRSLPCAAVPSAVAPDPAVGGGRGWRRWGWR